MIIRADARALPLTDGCVSCVVTSPPYWGLRDYGTGTWVGGDAACDHKIGRFERGGLSEKQASNIGSAGDEARGACPKCGAERVDAQIGLEPTPDAYVATIVDVFAEVWRVLKDDGTCWLNLGDSYAAGKAGRTDYGTGDPTSTLGPRRNGLPNNTRPGVVVVRAAPDGFKAKDLVGIPWRVAFALQAAGWYLRSDIIWSKPNPMPESVTDRPTKAHEYLFLLSKSERYYYDADAIKESAMCSARPETSRNHVGTKSSTTGNHAKGGTLGWNRPDAGRNKRSVWTINSQPFGGAHFATMPEALVEPCILAGCPLGGLVLDPFLGSGTVGAVASRLGRRWVGTDLSYQPLAQARTRQRGLMFSTDEGSHLGTSTR